jgi:sulfite reductase beta subunit-like hemoprotein
MRWKPIRLVVASQPTLLIGAMGSGCKGHLSSEETIGNGEPNMNEPAAERIKREKDGLDVWTDILGYARTGFGNIPPDDMDRFKWYGLYTQRPTEAQRFMLRIRIPNGIASSEQLETIGWISEVYAQSSGDITTRQDIQLHHIRIEDVPHIFSELEGVGLTTQEACGDVVRNVVGCPLAGVDDEELLDASPLVKRVSELFLNNRDFSNLPRKFKISISGCAQRCAQHEINDIGLVAVTNEEGEVGFDLFVGGGLGARPRLASKLGVFIWYDEVIEVVTRIVEIFRDHGDRSDRRKARLKFLVAKWGPIRFREELERRLGRQLQDHGGARVSSRNRTHVGIGAQRQKGRHYIGVAVTAGRLKGSQMISLAGIARRYAASRIRFTNNQNLILLDVPKENLASVESALGELDLHSESSQVRRGTIACTGQQFCKLAVVETKDRAIEVINHLEKVAPGFDSEIRISVTGCVNSCAQYQICDIGLVGVTGQVGGREAQFFQIHLGGHVGDNGAFGRKLSLRVPVEETKHYLARLIRSFQAKRIDDESFSQFVGRHSAAELETLDQLAELEEVLV